jgi:hypothetical protein
VDGKHVHLPDRAQPNHSSDHGMIIVDDDYVWSLSVDWIDRTNNVIHVFYGRRAARTGTGLGGGSTSAKWSSINDMVRLNELKSGRIEHALTFASENIAWNHVYPAQDSDGDNDPAAGYPPMGTRFQLDPSYMTDARLATYPAWKRPILRAMRDYGFFLGDSTSSSIEGFRIDGEMSWLSYGVPSPWVEYAKQQDVPSHDDGGRTLYYFDLASGVDWTKVRAIDPCVSRGDC